VKAPQHRRHQGVAAARRAHAGTRQAHQPHNSRHRGEGTNRRHEGVWQRPTVHIGTYQAHQPSTAPTGAIRAWQQPDVRQTRIRCISHITAARRGAQTPRQQISCTPPARVTRNGKMQKPAAHMNSQWVHCALDAGSHEGGQHETRTLPGRAERASRQHTHEPTRIGARTTRRPEKLAADT
jgi:hypothetical protein